MFHASSETRKSREELCLCKSLECATGKSEENAKQRIRDEQQHNYQEILTLEDDYRLFASVVYKHSLPQSQVRLLKMKIRPNKR